MTAIKRARTTDEWATFLSERFVNSDYQRRHTDYFGWCAAGVQANDDPEDVAAAWIEQCDEQTE